MTEGAGLNRLFFKKILEAGGSEGAAGARMISQRGDGPVPPADQPLQAFR